MRGVPDDRAILNPERLRRLMRYAGRFREGEGSWPLLYHVQPEGVDLRVSLAEAAILEESTRADRTARRVLEEQESLCCEESLKVCVFRELSDSHEGDRFRRGRGLGIE